MTTRQLMERDILARFFHGFMCSVTFFHGLFSPTSISALMRESAGPVGGTALIVAFGILWLLIWADTYINDVRPPQEQLRWTSRYRHWLHILAVVGNMAAVFTVAMTPMAYSGSKLWGCYLYLGVAGLGIAIAYRDALRRRGHLLCGV